MNVECEPEVAVSESTGGNRFARRMGQATGAVALVLIPLVLHAIPAGAAGKANIWISTNASTNTSLGLSILSNANLTGGTAGAPTGTITFQAFGPGDTTCTTPLFTSTAPVSGTSATSARFVPAHAGSYRWQSTYSGDATYSSAGPTPCADPSAGVTVSKAALGLSVAVAPSTPTAIHAAATISAGAAPTGSITFTLTGPDDTFCGRGSVYTSTVAVTGGGAYDSGMFSPARSGQYTWQVSYSGDADNYGVSLTPCLALNVTQTVTAAPPSGDFNGSGKTQLSLFHPSTGIWYIQDAVGGAINQLLWGQTGDIPVPGDYNADGRTDVAVFRPATGQWLVRGISETVYGASTDIPVPGDYNADGRTDIAVFRPSTGQWLVKGISETVYGARTDIPVPGDYNGDGRTDVAVFRPSTGQWLVKGISETVYGVSSDIPVPADYNGDGRTDVGVWRPANGTWYVKGLFEKVLGLTGDIPQPGDYDGDGRADPTVFRPNPGSWTLDQSTAGPASSGLGVVGDVVTSLVGVVWSLTGMLGQ